MRPAWVLLAGLGLVLGCVGSGKAVTAPVSTPGEAHPAASSSGSPAGPYADTALTPLANEVTTLVFAATTGHPLPGNRLHLATAQAHWSSGSTPPEGPPLAFAASVQVELADVPAPRERLLQAQLVLTRQRLTARVDGVGSNEERHLEPNTEGLPEVDALVDNLLADVRAGRTRGYQADDTDCDAMELFGHGHACQQIEEPVVAHPSVVEALRNPAAGRRRYVLNQVVVVARATGGGS